MSLDESRDAASIAAVAALADDLRRRMYAFIRNTGEPVTRDQAAAEVGISRKLAAFHLDKLVDAGLLRAGAARGLRRAGRAAKTYEPTDRVVQISIPPRQHEFLAEILLDSVLTSGASADVRQVVLDTAAARGRQLGEIERHQGRPGRLGAERALALARTFLVRLGFEPTQAAPGQLILRNCPFQPLAARSTELVCGINHAFLSGFLEGLGTSSAVAVLEPQPGACCVELRAASSPAQIPQLAT
ncbi:MAG TPA: helix-turn-helix domain-containing protein [Streptosporangiaceae bacterium]